MTLRGPQDAATDYPVDASGIPIKNPASKKKSPPAFKPPPKEVSIQDAAIAKKNSRLRQAESTTGND